MTVKDLIEILSKMPQDAGVMYDLHSDVAGMDEEQVVLITPDHNGDKIIKRNGRYETYAPQWWDVETMGEPKFETVVKFPGS